MNRFADKQRGQAQRPSMFPASGLAHQHDAMTGTNTGVSASLMIENAHMRSAAYGLAHNLDPDFSRIGRADLAQLVEQNRMLYTHAMPVMETLYEQIVNTHNMVILTDAAGLIVHSIGDADFLEKADRVALQPGAGWSEQDKGTNAIGTAIAERAPAQVHADQHFLSANHFLTCSAAPIFDHEGKVIGVLDVSGDRHSFHKHTMALVRMSAQMIENQLFSAAFQDAITLHFHCRPEFIGTLMEGIASFTPGGRFLSANRSGLFQLGVPLAALKSHTFSSLFGLPVSALYDHYRTASPGLLNMCLPSGLRVHARAELRLSNKVFQQAPDALQADAGSGQPFTRRASDIVQPRRLSSLRFLENGDPQISSVVAKVGKVIGRDIPILIMGETGTGKDLLAQAIHNDSPRAAGTFVAVNCASIPETLIESELFGYEDGAFTGARRKGAIGKILQANGGTLFLDEIGDMPLSLQARLLRVLQERVITPLGSAKSIPVNVALVCATNRNLRDMIAKGAFREDLYYRINGMVVKLPPLRERTDLEAVVQKLLSLESHGGQYVVAPEVLDLFSRHAWPGNIRQLSNLLRTAIVMAGDEREIRREHLPDDFLEDAAEVLMEATSTPRNDSADRTRLSDMEISAIRNALEQHNGNVSAAARSLGVSRNTIYRKLNLD